MKKYMKISALLLTGVLLMASIPTMAEGQQEKMNQFIDQLMAKMTVEEKIGQLNLMPAQTITTGAEKNSPLLKLAAEGKLGAILNMKGYKDIREAQETAVKKSRLGIPLLMGLDVIHGSRIRMYNQ